VSYNSTPLGCASFSDNFLHEFRHNASGPALAIYSEELWVVGAKDDTNENSAQSLRYNFTANAWADGPGLVRDRAYVTIITYRDF
jgi:hypothetical protein